jgi:hypothetical protein
MFGGTEFGSGSLACDEGLGGLLFILAASLIFKYPRIAAVSGLAAAYLSLPLFVYLVFPRLSARCFREIGQCRTSHERNSFGMDGGLQEFS